MEMHSQVIVAYKMGHGDPGILCAFLCDLVSYEKFFQVILSVSHFLSYWIN